MKIFYRSAFETDGSAKFVWQDTTPQKKAPTQDKIKAQIEAVEKAKRVPTEKEKIDQSYEKAKDALKNTIKTHEGNEDFAKAFRQALDEVVESTEIMSWISEAEINVQMIKRKLRKWFLQGKQLLLGEETPTVGEDVSSEETPTVVEEKVNSILTIDQISEQLDSSNVDLALKAVFDNLKEDSDNSDLNDIRGKITSFYNPKNPNTEKNKGVLVYYLSFISSYSNTSIDFVIKFLYGNDASLEKIVSDEVFVLAGKGHAKVDIFDASKHPESIKKIKEIVKLFNNVLSEKYLSFYITDSDDPYRISVDFISIAALEKFTPNEIAEIIFHECSHAYEHEIFEAEEDFKKDMSDLHEKMIPDELRLKIKELHENRTIEKRIELEASSLYKRSLISIFDESTYYDNKERLGGHPYDNIHELFASTASIIKYYPEQLIQNINKLNENDKKTAIEVVKMVTQKYQGKII